MKNLISLVGRFSVFAVFAVTVIGFSGSNAFGQGEDLFIPSPKSSNAIADECSFIDQGKITFQAITFNCKQAQDAFQTAAAFVLGAPLTNIQLYKYIVSTRVQPYASSFVAKYKAGLQFTDAAGFLKQALAADDKLRTSTVNNAFQEVYGRNATPAELASYDPKIIAKKAWFTTIVSSEITKLNHDSNARQVMIILSYAFSLGRVPSPAEIQYWMPMTEHYAQIVEAGRNWLYSVNGAKDLGTAARLAFAVKNNRQPTDNELKVALADFIKRRLIYIEMTK